VTHLILDVQLLNPLKKPKIISENPREVRRNLGKKGKNQREVLFSFKTPEKSGETWVKKVKIKEKYYSCSKP
jgi:hypothetical protein